MNKLKRIIVWLRRIRHCRGFGIQSPTDYRFARYVVGERWPYYAYDELQVADADWLHSKVGRLCLRLANELQPDVIVDRADFGIWLRAGCRRARIVKQLPPVGESYGLAVVAVGDDLTALMDRAAERSVLLVVDLWRNRRRWAAVAADARVSVSFDLYYCGIAFFDPHRNKKAYVVNF